MKQFYFGLFVFLVFLSNTCISYAQLSLDSCHAKARRNFPLIRQYGLIDQTTEFTLSNANKAFLPQLSVNLIGGIVDGFPSFDLPGSPNSNPSDYQLISVVQINQAIWDGGITKASKEIAKTSAEIDKADVNVALYQLRERIDNLFFGILLIDEQLEQTKIYFSNLERHLSRLEVAVENGTAYKSDLDEIQVEILNAEERKSELIYNKNAYLKVLSVMIGEEIPFDEKLLRPAETGIDLNGAINRPELSVFEQQKAMIEAKSQFNKSNLYPKVGLLGFGTFLTPGIEFGASEVNRILVAGLSVSWEIGGLYRSGNNKKLDEIGLQRIQNQEETFLFNINLQLEQTGVELQKYKELIDNTAEVLEIKQRIKKAYEVKYENGISTMTELLDKTNEENMAKQKLIMQEIQYLQKVYQYKYKSGN
jgi:outer membrane protein TolC